MRILAFFSPWCPLLVTRRVNEEDETVNKQLDPE